jgi:hypothetical protein
MTVGVIRSKQVSPLEIKTMNTIRTKSIGPAPRRRHPQRPAGLTVLEFIGCLIALVGGVWLGAIYLGIDIHHLAYDALSQSELLDKVPEQWRPTDPEAANTPSPAELARAVQEELVALRHEISALRATKNGPSPTAEALNGDGSSTDAPVSTQQAKSASLAFWNRVQDVVRGETALQIDAESAATSGNATKVAALKGRISRFAASAIRAIPTDGVDPAAIELSSDLVNWYDRGGTLYEQAVQIWESPARGQNSPALTKEWKHAQSQHRNEGQLLNDKIAGVCDSLTRRFGEGFTLFVAF